MDEIRINAAIAELNNLIQSLIQRNINLAGEVATLGKKVEELTPKEPPKE
jgi:hypothetical protein